MEGASSAVKERALKILDRLMARLVLAETERDNAFGKYSSPCPTRIIALF